MNDDGDEHDSIKCHIMSLGDDISRRSEAAQMSSLRYRSSLSTNPYTSLVRTQHNNNGVVDIRLCSHCAPPPPPSRPIGRIACAQNFPDTYLRLPGILNDPFCCMTLWSLLQWMQQRQPHRRLSMLLNGADNPRKLHLPVGHLHPHLIHGSLGSPKSSSKTACQLVQLLLHSSP